MSYGVFGGLSIRMKQSQNQVLRGMKGKGENNGQREKRERIYTQRFRVNLQTICPKYTKERKKKKVSWKKWLDQSILLFLSMVEACDCY